LLRAILIKVETTLSTLSDNATPALVSLATLHRGDSGVVAEILADGEGLGDEGGATIALRLIEIGFVPGEIVQVVAELRPGGDPLAVRVAGTCFALRRREAQAVMVRR
jgi:ferrous iron transport protein A